MNDRKINIITHQKNPSLEEALINNVYGIPAEKTSTEILVENIKQLFR